MVPDPYTQTLPLAPPRPIDGPPNICLLYLYYLATPLRMTELNREYAGRISDQKRASASRSLEMGALPICLYRHSCDLRRTVEN